MERKALRVAAAPLYLELYDRVAPEYREKIMPMVREVLSLIGKYADVTALDPVTTHEDVKRLKERCAGAECLTLIHMSYSPSLLVADTIRDTGLPVLMVDTTPDVGFEAMSPDFLMMNHGIHGVMDLASVLRAKDVRYAVCAGHFKSEGFERRLETRLREICAAVRYRNQDIGVSGEAFDMMGDFVVDYGEIKRQFGHSVVPLTLEQIRGGMAEAGEGAVEALYEEETGNYVFNGDADSLKTNIRQYLAYQKLFSEQGITAYTMNFNDFDDMPAPFYAINKLLADGTGYAGEGDVITASLGRALNILAEKAMFSEFFCPDWNNDLILMSHMGETDVRFAKEGSRVELAEKTALGKAIPSYYYRFAIQPMRMTFATWTRGTAGELKLLCGLLDCEDIPPYGDLGVPQFFVRPQRPLHEFLELYSQWGGGHHIYLAQGDVTESMVRFAAWIGVECNILR